MDVHWRDANVFATASDDGLVTICNTASTTPQTVLKGHTVYSCTDNRPQLIAYVGINHKSF